MTWYKKFGRLGDVVSQNRDAGDRSREAGRRAVDTSQIVRSHSGTFHDHLFEQLPPELQEQVCNPDLLAGVVANAVIAETGKGSHTVTRFIGDYRNRVHMAKFREEQTARFEQLYRELPEELRVQILDLDNQPQDIIGKIIDATGLDETTANDLLFHLRARPGLSNPSSPS